MKTFSLVMRAETGEYNESDWSRVEVELSVTDRESVEAALQKYVDAMGFDFKVNVE